MKKLLFYHIVKNYVERLKKKNKLTAFLAICYKCMYTFHNENDYERTK
ncbi:hypothetical protein LM7421_160376 [Listeria monocytogenes]|nr:hypothetical protein LM7421_160376 [Listeria monocytogenes]